MRLFNGQNWKRFLLINLVLHEVLCNAKSISVNNTQFSFNIFPKISKYKKKDFPAKK